MPAISPDSLWCSPNFLGQRPVHHRMAGCKEERPLLRGGPHGRHGGEAPRSFSADGGGWARAWAAPVKLDAGAAPEVAKAAREEQLGPALVTRVVSRCADRRPGRGCPVVTANAFSSS
jgi:hypothetical protein